MNAAGSGQRPASTDKAAVKLWLQGCEAAYHLKHPNQVIEDGIMWRSGTKPCTGSCPSQWSAAGKSIALAANEEPLINLAGGTSGSVAADWCADLTFNHFIQPLAVSVESRLRAHPPAAGPETYSWNQGVRGRVQHPAGERRSRAAGRAGHGDGGVRRRAGPDDPGEDTALVALRQDPVSGHQRDGDLVRGNDRQLRFIRLV